MDVAHGTGDTGHLCAREYAALRQTIAIRGTARMLTVPVICLGWAALALLAPRTPSAALVSLTVLVAGFEAVHALHVGTERIGRYIQVYYESRPVGPRWESTAMLVGPALPGGGIDPLFSGVFLGTSLLNLVTTSMPWSVSATVTSVTVVHAAFAGRIVRARLAASRQRAVELESFKAVQSQQRSTG